MELKTTFSEHMVEYIAIKHMEALAFFRNRISILSEVNLQILKVLTMFGKNFLIFCLQTILALDPLCVLSLSSQMIKKVCIWKKSGKLNIHEPNTMCLDQKQFILTNERRRCSLTIDNAAGRQAKWVTEVLEGGPRSRVSMNLSRLYTTLYTYHT